MTTSKVATEGTTDFCVRLGGGGGGEPWEIPHLPL